jgi:hypothetical protein
MRPADPEPRTVYERCLPVPGIDLLPLPLTFVRGS